jgi:hypothetical protein
MGLVIPHRGYHDITGAYVLVEKKLIIEDVNNCDRLLDAIFPCRLVSRGAILYCPNKLNRSTYLNKITLTLKTSGCSRWLTSSIFNGARLRPTAARRPETRSCGPSGCVASWVAVLAASATGVVPSDKKALFSASSQPPFLQQSDGPWRKPRSAAPLWTGGCRPLPCPLPKGQRHNPSKLPLISKASIVELQVGSCRRLAFVASSKMSCSQSLKLANLTPLCSSIHSCPSRDDR